MKSWKLLLGVGGACAACCALPLAGGLAALLAGASGGIAVGAGQWWLAALAAVAVALVGVASWRRRQLARKASACALECGCQKGAGCA